jgi:hypothetical protein
MGIDFLTQQNMQNAGLAGIDRLAGNAMFPQSQMDKTQYAVSSQMPTSAEVLNSGYEPKTNSYTGLPTQAFAEGGIANIPRYDGGDGSVVTEAPVEEQKPLTMAELSDKLKAEYNSNADYVPTWQQFQSLKETDPAQWHKHQLSWLGHQQGWQIGQNTSERNAAGIPVIQDEIEQAKKAGLSQEEIDTILGGSSQAANYQNQNRIAKEAAQGQGWVNQTIPGGYTTLGALALAAAAPYALGAIGTAGTAGAAGSGAIGAGAAGAGAAGAAAASTTPAWMLAAGKGAAIGAAMGGGSAAITGGDVGKGILYGGITGAVGGGAGNAFGGGYAGNMAGGALAGGTGSALRGGNVLEGAGMGAAGGALSTGISGLDAPDAVKQGLNMFGKPLVMSQVRNAFGGGQSPQGPQGISGIPGATQNAGISANTPGMFNFAPNTPPAMGLGISSPQAVVPAPMQQPLFLSKLSEFKYDSPYEMAAGGMAHGGGISDLGSYSDGGRLLKGPGDGMSDHIPATIGHKQSARLAEGEFVVPADVVSHLGNGSTDAGAKQLYKMMDNIRRARTGNPKQGKQINPDKFTPKG